MICPTTAILGEIMLVYFSVLIGCGVFVSLSEKYRTAALYLTLLIAIIFPFISDTERWNLFYFAKTYSVVIPIFILAFIQSKFYHELEWIKNLQTYIPNLVKFVFILNILEGCLLLLSIDQYILLVVGLILIITMPTFSFNEHQNIGFENIPWVMCYTLCFILAVILYPNQTNFIFPITIAVFIPIVFCYFIKDWSKWFSFRVYSIYFILVLDVLFSNGDFLIYDSVSGFLSLQNNEINSKQEVLIQSLAIPIGAYLLIKWWKIRTKMNYN